MKYTHHIQITQPKSKCGEPTHTDLLIECSCGFEKHIPHGELGQAAEHILFHRVAVIEEILGIDFRVQHIPVVHPLE